MKETEQKNEKKKQKTGSGGERTGADAYDVTGNREKAGSGRTGMEMSKCLTDKNEVAGETTGKISEKDKL